MGSQEGFVEFKREILTQAVTEDWHGVWEPLWWLQGGGAIEGQSEEERQAWAERALRELFADGLIYFFEVADDLAVNQASASGHLSAADVDQTLSSDWWRTVPLTTGGVWWGPTPAGESAIG